MSKKNVNDFEFIDDAFINRSFFDLLGDMYMDPGFLVLYQPDLADLDKDIDLPARKSSVRVHYPLVRDPFAQDTRNIREYFEKAISSIPGLKEVQVDS